MYLTKFPFLCLERVFLLYCPNCKSKADRISFKKQSNCTACEATYQFYCKLCDSYYKNLKSARNHLQYERTRSKLKCPHCCYLGSTTSTLKYHIISKHTYVSPEDYHECLKCRRKYKTVICLNKHLKHQHPPENIRESVFDGNLYSDK